MNGIVVSSLQKAAVSAGQDVGGGGSARAASHKSAMPRFLELILPDDWTVFRSGSSPLGDRGAGFGKETLDQFGLGLSTLIRRSRLRLATAVHPREPGVLWMGLPGGSRFGSALGYQAIKQGFVSLRSIFDVVRTSPTTKPSAGRAGAGEYLKRTVDRR